MANPNLLSTATVSQLATTQLMALTTAQVAVFSNANSSGQLWKVDELVVANKTTGAVSATVQVYSAAALGGTAYNLINALSIPANSSLAVINKQSAQFLLENQSIGASAGAASSIDLTASAEIIS
jgi:hypothetical protein